MSSQIPVFEHIDPKHIIRVERVLSEGCINSNMNMYNEIEKLVVDTETTFGTIGHPSEERIKILREGNTVSIAIQADVSMKELTERLEKEGLNVAVVLPEPEIQFKELELDSLKMFNVPKLINKDYPLNRVERRKRQKEERKNKRR